MLTAAPIVTAQDQRTEPSPAPAERAAGGSAGQASSQPAPETSGAVPGPADFTAIVERLAPSVVAVTTKAGAAKIERGGEADESMGELFRHFFGREMPSMPKTPRSRSALGSGFLIDTQGHVVTNAHVVENAAEIRVVLPDRTPIEAQLVGQDPATDIAVLKLDGAASGTLPQPLAWGDSAQLKPGAWTIAIGSPFGLGGTVTVGVLSARSRDIRSGPFDDFLQTDASINRGNSGGPLFNQQGKVIGVNTAIVSETGGNIGIGFAVPSNLAQDVVAQLIATGRVARGFIGVALQPVTPEVAEALGLPEAEGALIADVTEASPASRAGIKPGDVLVEIDGEDVEGVREVSRSVAAIDPGKRLPAKLLRDGETVEVTLEVGRRPDQVSAAMRGGEAAKEATEQRLGVALAPLDEAARTRAGLDQTATGVLVRRVAPGTPAAKGGLKSGDIIVSAGQEPVSDTEGVASYWQKVAGTDKPALFRIRRGENYLFVTVKG